MPLFVKYPRQRRGVEDKRDAQDDRHPPDDRRRDGCPPPWKVDGRSLRAAPVTGRRVMVFERAGGVVQADADDVRAGVLATARRNAALFGVGVAPDGPIGPHRELVGRAVGTLGSTSARGAHVRLDGDTLFADVRKGSEFVPARVTGEVGGGSLAPGSAIAISVNGRVAATTRLFDVDGRNRFAVLVPERSLDEGRNSVEVFSISSSAGGVRLARLGGTSARRSTSCRRTERASSCRRADPYGSRRAGSTAGSSRRRSREARSGFEAGPPTFGHHALVDRVLVFSGRRLVSSSATTVFRWDVDAILGKTKSPRVGFVTELPLSDVRDGRLRVLAVRGNVVSELEVPGPRSGVIAAAGAG